MFHGKSLKKKIDCIPCFKAHDHCRFLDKDWGISEWPTIVASEYGKKLRAQRKGAKIAQASVDEEVTAGSSVQKGEKSSTSHPDTQLGSQPLTLSTGSRSSSPGLVLVIPKPQEQAVDLTFFEPAVDDRSLSLIRSANKALD